MCYGCWEEMGKPLIKNDKTMAAASLVKKLYEFSCVGGDLHIVTDDWNIDDEQIEWCMKNADSVNKQERAVAQELGSYLLTMTLDERASALAIFENFENRE